MSIIDKKVFDFLIELEQNNDRDWFAEHKSEFDTQKHAMKTVFEAVFKSLNEHDIIDDYKIFRIYRDVRFSNNKLPYKTHFAASFHRKKPELRGGYYIRIKPNDQSFIACGFWSPEKEDLLRIRKEFEIDDSDIRAIIEKEDFKAVWGELEGDELKTAPRNFDKEHPAIDLIRKKQFIFSKKFTDREVLTEQFVTQINSSFKVIKPYFDYMSDVLTTDLNGQRII